MSEENMEVEVGNEVTGTVVKVEDKQVLVDIGYKSEGGIPISELSNLHVENASDVVQEGDKLTLQVNKVEAEEEVLSKKLVDAEKAWDDLIAKYKNKETSETTVKEVVKGGLVVDVGLRTFIPASLVETFFVEDFADYQDQTLTV